MRVLLDECLPSRLRFLLVGHDVKSAQYVGLAGTIDRDLLAAMRAKFDVLVTMDSSLPYQNSLTGQTIAVVVLTAASNRLPHLLPLVPEVLRVLDAIKPGEVRVVGPDP